ncbi:hypothetical protein [Phytohabitans suffuscus]|uniref:hypothetical protein n=1 Tax=Phytohabitans suffuscus TaxID=624315 RepID=UPI0015670674|nr:hypothetical protein [Phytohabitans suffuscus]
MVEPKTSGARWCGPVGARSSTRSRPVLASPTRLAALDDALIDAAGRFGRLLGGGDPVTTETRRLDLRELHRALDRLCREYAAAPAVVRTEAELRAGSLPGPGGAMHDLSTVEFTGPGRLCLAPTLRA